MLVPETAHSISLKPEDLKKPNCVLPSNTSDGVLPVPSGRINCEFVSLTAELPTAVAPVNLAHNLLFLTL